MGVPSNSPGHVRNTVKARWQCPSRHLLLGTLPSISEQSPLASHLKCFHPSSCLTHIAWPCPELFLEDFIKSFIRATYFAAGIFYRYLRPPPLPLESFDHFLFSFRAQIAFIQILLVFGTSVSTLCKENGWTLGFLIPQRASPGISSPFHNAAGCPPCFLLWSSQGPLGKAGLQLSPGAGSQPFPSSRLAKPQLLPSAAD